MTRKSPIIIGVAGAAIVLYALKRLFSDKHFHTMPYGYGIKLKRAVTIDRPPEDLYRYWRNLENLQKLLNDDLSIKLVDETRSHWTLKVPRGLRLEWTAEITVDRENEMIGWRSIGRAGLDNAGYIRFVRATGGRRTVVRVAIQYNPPGGKLGAVFATLVGEKPGHLVGEALRKFKQLMETGEITVTGRRRFHAIESVEVASEDSFPASDAPAWTTGSAGFRKG